MDFRKLREMVGDPRFISGIYNYCDRWCERCEFTSRCLNYAMSEGDDVDPAARDITNKAFWDRLHSVFQQTKEMILEDAKERGIEFDPEDLEEIGRQEERRRQEVESHELSKAARAYADKVDEWFDASEALFEEKGEALKSELLMGLDGTNPQADAASIKDAVEVIRWYQYQICVKLMRALHRDELDEELEKDYPSDSDGSAKVAMIAVDRSIGAWGVLREHLPAQSDTILDMLVRLDRLRRRAEQTFPKARAFLRPGFDYPVPPVATESAEEDTR